MPEGKKKFTGTFVYVKASVTPQNTKHSPNKQRSYTYKLYHPKFPHEPTSDQFFDKAQWEAYYETGRDMARSLLKECSKVSLEHDAEFPLDINLEKLCKMLDTMENNP